MNSPSRKQSQDVKNFTSFMIRELLVALCSLHLWLTYWRLVCVGQGKSSERDTHNYHYKRVQDLQLNSSLLIKGFPMATKMQQQAFWFGRSQHEKQTKQTNYLPSQIDKVPTKHTQELSLNTLWSFLSKGCAWQKDQEFFKIML